jgi:CDP-6-deoxy-D-xylo-4-hexulose-3-dehydrase
MTNTTLDFRADLPAMADDSLLETIRRSVAAYCEREHDSSFDPANPVVRLHEPTFGAEEINAALECMLSTRVTMGPKVLGFEEQFARHFQTEHAVMNNSGSSANLLAVAALANPAMPDGLRPGDEVIVPSLSWSTTVWPLVQMGLIPVIVDIDPTTWNIDVEAAAAAIGPRTRGMMIVPVYGNPCDMTAITQLCADKNLILIEDCCEALGATYEGKPVGSFGAVGTFSFYYSHHISTMEGGICTTDNHELAELMRILRAHGWVRDCQDKQKWLDQYPEIDERFLFVNLGYNLRPMEISGAMGQIQLPKLDSFVQARRANAEYYQRELGQFDDVFAFQEELPNAKSSWFGFSLRVKDGAGFDVETLRTHLAAKQIETRPIICGNIAKQPAMQMYPHRVPTEMPNADAVMADAFSFGNHQSLDDAAKAYVVDSISEFVKGAR